MTSTSSPASSSEPIDLPVHLRTLAGQHGFAELELFASGVAHVLTCRVAWKEHDRKRAERAMELLRHILFAIRDAADLARCPWPILAIVDVSQSRIGRALVLKAAEDPTWHDGRMALYAFPIIEAHGRGEATNGGEARAVTWHGPQGDMTAMRNALLRTSVSEEPPLKGQYTMADFTKRLADQEEFSDLAQRLRDQPSRGRFSEEELKSIVLDWVMSHGMRQRSQSHDVEGR